jgi:hypothetical protein
MERVATLLDRLKDQMAANAAIDDMLMTVEMLQSELLHLKSSDNTKNTSFAFNISSTLSEELPLTENEEKVVVSLEIDPAEIEEELEQIKRTAEARNSISLKNRRPFSFDPLEDTPTLYNQKKSNEREVNEMADASSDTLNDKLRESRKELSEALKDTPVKDLKKAIGINDRFQFINELFQGDEVMYERSIKTINGFSIYPEAEYWIRRELKTKLGWGDDNPAVIQFDQLVKRRFPSM